jgi:hypothetical protein
MWREEGKKGTVGRGGPKKSTILLALVGGCMVAVIGKPLGEFVTWLVGKIGTLTGAYVGIGGSALLLIASIWVTLEVLVKGLIPKTATPKRVHAPMAALAPTVIVAAGIPLLAAGILSIQSGGTSALALVAAGVSPIAPAVSASSVCTPDGKVSGLTESQMRNAAAIVAAGRERGVSERGQVIAVATALQESQLKMYANRTVPSSLAIPHEAVGADHDSVGLFQQRAAGWGPLSSRMDAKQSAAVFYAALDRVPNWESMPLTAAAQTVQRSAYPYAYAKHEAKAAQIVGSVRGIRCSTGLSKEA